MTALPIDAAGWDARARHAATPCGAGEMVWRSWGEGRPLLLLHGGAGSWLHWIRTIPAFAGQRTVIAPDLPGLGGSAAVPGEWSAAGVAAVVADGLRRVAAVAAAGIDVVGFSFGATVAGLLAASLGRLCGALVLVGAGGLGTPREKIELERVRHLDGEARVAAHRRNLARLMIADPARIDDAALAIQDWNAGHTRANSVGIATTTVLRDALGGVSARLAAIWGSADAVARGSLPARIAVLRELRPDVAIRIIPEAGHWVAFEAPDSFNDTVRALLDRPAAQGESPT